MTSIYKFYMQACDKTGNILAGAPKKDLEADFEGLRYKECTGLNDIGNPNVYTEEFADSNRLRVYIPENVTHKPTTVTLTLYFVGNNRYKTYDAFNNYLKSSKFFIYYDTARKKKLTFFLKESITVNSSLWYGDMPYIEVQYKLSNIFGKTEDIDVEE